METINNLIKQTKEECEKTIRRDERVDKDDSVAVILSYDNNEYKIKEQ